MSSTLESNQSINQSRIYSANIPRQSQAQWRDSRISVQLENRENSSDRQTDGWMDGRRTLHYGISSSASTEPDEPKMCHKLQCKQSRGECGKLLMINCSCLFTHDLMSGCCTLLTFDTLLFHSKYWLVLINYTYGRLYSHRFQVKCA